MGVQQQRVRSNENEGRGNCKFSTNPESISALEIEKEPSASGSSGAIQIGEITTMSLLQQNFNTYFPPNKETQKTLVPTKTK